MFSAAKDRFAWIGIACCAVSASAYTLGNICMRQLTVLHCDPIWAVFNRELVTSAAIVPWLILAAVRRQPSFPTKSMLWRLLLVGLLVEMVGNLAVQWAFGVVGLAITIPAVYGVMVTGGALLGFILLGERVSRRSFSSIALLVIALVLLGVGAEAAGRSDTATKMLSGSPTSLILGVLAGGLAGATFALLSATVRHSMNQNARPMAVAFLIPMMGVVSLGPLVVWRSGFEPFLTTPWQQVCLMLAAGVFNLVGFLSLVYALRHITVAHANIVNASQVAMASLAGVAIFHEPPNVWLAAGCLLTIVGIMRFDRPADGGGI